MSGHNSGYFLYENSTVEAKKMRRSARPTANLENEAESELKAKEIQSNDKIATIAKMDNDTMVEAFKYMNYCQLAKNSLVSKRYCNLIQTHRHSLARLYVAEISMLPIPIAPSVVEIFDKELSSEAYNEWIIRNNYSKQVPPGDQVACTQSIQNIPNGYKLNAYCHYNDPNHRKWIDTTRVFFACVEFNDENWPAFQHFVRLITDPFIRIDRVHLIDQNDFFNLLTGAINSDHDRLQCSKLFFDLNGNGQKFITWIKNHVRCNKFYIFCVPDSNHDEVFLDFFVTGAHCTPSIKIGYCDFSKAVVVLVQKFLDLENWDEYQGVHFIKSSQLDENQAIEVLQNDYAKFVVKEERDEDDESTAYVFEFVNNAIGKKLQFTATVFDNEDDNWNYRFPVLLMKIKNV